MRDGGLNIQRTHYISHVETTEMETPMSFDKLFLALGLLSMSSMASAEDSILLNGVLVGMGEHLECFCSDGGVLCQDSDGNNSATTSGGYFDFETNQFYNCANGNTVPQNPQCDSFDREECLWEDGVYDEDQCQCWLPMEEPKTKEPSKTKAAR